MNGSDEDKRKTSSQDSSITLFLLPGLNVALNYQSHGKKGKDRRAKLYSNVLIDSMPKEMSISPSFLDYLSETLDTIDEGQMANQIARSSIHAGGDSIGAQGQMGAQGPDGFAVDVVVHAMVKPSTVLFSCHPKAKVECTLRVPKGVNGVH